MPTGSTLRGDHLFDQAAWLNVEYGAMKISLERKKRQKPTALTCNYKQVVVSRAERNPAFVKPPLSEAAALVSSGEPAALRLIL